jgi:hypothetical protein
MRRGVAAAGLVAGWLVGTNGLAAATPATIAVQSVRDSCFSPDSVAYGPCAVVAYQPGIAGATSGFIDSPFFPLFSSVTPAFADATFITAFDNWKASQGTNAATWRIVDANVPNDATPSLNDITLSVTGAIGSNTQLGGFGTLSFSVMLGSNYAGPPLRDLVWTSALYVSYRPPFTSGIVANTLDTWSFSNNGQALTGTGPFTRACEPLPPGPGTLAIGGSPQSPARGYCDPIYPFQYDGTFNAPGSEGPKFFFDAPAASWPYQTFRAITLLSTVTVVTDTSGAVTDRILTVYDGVSWGFDLVIVPAPGAPLVFAPALLLLAAAGRRSAARG